MVSNLPVKVMQQAGSEVIQIMQLLSLDCVLFIERTYLMLNLVGICGSQHELTHKCHEICPAGHFAPLLPRFLDSGPDRVRECYLASSSS